MLGIVLLLAACHAPLDRPAPAGPSSSHLAAPAFPEPAPLAPAAARAALFAHIPHVDASLARLAGYGVHYALDRPRVWMLPEVERAVLLRYRGRTPHGRLERVAALGFSAVAPLPPAAMADVLLDPVVEKRALDAKVWSVVARPIDLPDLERHVVDVALLRLGTPPWVFDFRFRVAAERWDLADGTIAIRHDPVAAPGGTGITLYRGACVIAPVPGGCRVTEMLILGSDVRLPFFLEGVARGETWRLFQDRADTLWREARSRAGR